MKSKTIKLSDIANHPTNRMDAKHWVEEYSSQSEMSKGAKHWVEETIGMNKLEGTYIEVELAPAFGDNYSLIVEVADNSVKSMQTLRSVLDENGYNDSKILDFKFSKANIILKK